MSAPTTTRPAAGGPASGSRPPTGARSGAPLLGGGRRSAGHTLGLAAVTAATVWLVLLSWRSLTADPARYYVPLAVLAVLIGGVGGVARWLRVPAYAYVPAQLLLTGWFVLLTVTGSAVPSPTTIEAFWQAWDAAVVSAQSYMAPVPLNAPPIHPLLILGGALGLLLGDVLAGALRRVPASALVLLSLYALPATVTGRGASVWVFVLAAAGFLLMLFIVQDEQVGRWGRPMGGSRTEEESDPAGFGVRTGAVRGSAVAIGGAATALAIALPAVIPTLDVALFDGPGSGNGSLEVTSPVADMRRDLQRGADIPLVTLSSPRDQAPSYLRISVLANYSGEEWTPGDRDIPEDNVAQGEMPPLDGVAGTLERRFTPYRVEVSPQFESTWLPTMPQISEINAGTDWRYDAETMDFFATDDQTTAGLRYDMVGVDLELDPASMDSAVAGSASVDSIFTDLPGDLPAAIRERALEVTADAPTRFRKAQALQRWFRTDGGFVYDLDAAESIGSGADELVRFLEPSGRRGYCEQYAAAMAVMARTLGIPARVAIGFLEPEASGPQSWTFSAHDLHAWPELYFPGSGWVRFEPTPAARADGVPGYTEADLAPLPDRSATPTPRGTEEDLPERADGESETTAADDTGADESALPWRTVGGTALGLLVVVGALVTPRALRRRRSERRWRGAEVEDVWAEVRDTALDLGRPWPRGRSPRETADWLRTVMADPVPDPADAAPARPRAVGAPRPEQPGPALDRLVGALERARYAARSGDAGDPAAMGRAAEERRADGHALVAALRAGAAPRARRRADWWPASVVRREPSTASDQARRAVVTGRGTSTGPSAGGSGMVDQIG